MGFFFSEIQASSSELRHCQEQRPLCERRAAEEVIDGEDSGSSKQNQLSPQKHCPLYQKRPAHGSSTPTAEQGTDGHELDLLLALIYPRWLTLLSANLTSLHLYFMETLKGRKNTQVSWEKLLFQPFPGWYEVVAASPGSRG